MKLIKKKIISFWTFVLITIILIYSRNLFKGELFRSHDLDYHGSRVVNYYLALKQGQLPPRWAPNLNHKFGSPVFMFSYTTPYIFSTFFYAIGLSVEWSINLVIILSIISATTGFYTLGKISRDNKFGLAASMLFIFSPYILATIFIRGALGEITFFGLIPWMFVFIKLVTKNELTNLTSIIFTFLTTLFLLTHPPSIVISVPILIGWLYISTKTNKKKKSVISKTTKIKAVTTIITSIFLVQFFWLPFLTEYKYVKAGQGYSTNDFFTKYPKTLDLIWSKWSYGGLADINSHEHFTHQIGIIYLLILILSLKELLIKRKKINKNINLDKNITIYWILVFLFSVFLMIPISKSIWKVLYPIKSLQFPWRLLWVPTLASTMLYLQKKSLTKNQIKCIFLLTSIIGVISLTKHTKPAGYFSTPNHDWLNYSGFTTPGKELDPIWFASHHNLGIEEEVIIKKQNQRLVNELTGTYQNIGSSKIIYWDGTTMEYEIITPQNADVLQKTSYFPGFKTWVDNQETTINFKDKEFEGRIIIPVNAGAHKIKTQFTNDVWDRKLGDILTLIGLGIFSFQIIKLIKKT